MKTRILITVLALFAAVSSFAAGKTHELISPDGKLRITVDNTDGLSYTVHSGNDLLIADSPISMTLTDGKVYDGKGRLLSNKRRTVNEKINTVVYKKAVVEDHFNEMTMKFKEYSVVFRAYDDGVAYRFISHSKTPFEVKSELATFAFAQDWNMFVPYVCQHTETLDSQLWNSFENQYAYTKISEWNKERYSFLPLLVDGPNGKKICIAEADLINYPGMFLYNYGEASTLNGYNARVPKRVWNGQSNEEYMKDLEREDFIARYDGATEFPWRIISVSEEDMDMANNDMVYRLSTPSEGDFSWVKPGKVAWEWWNASNLSGVDFVAGSNTDTYKYYIDFASKYGIEYVIMDGGWYRKNVFDISPRINLEEILAHAEKNNVGIILWMHYTKFDTDMEEICKHYSAMGVKGFKIDFLDRDDQNMVYFHKRASETAAKYKLMIDMHGTYKPTGLHRTYPNLINFEGVYGLENMKWATPDVDQVTYDVTAPFIRMVAGPMDYTQGAMKNAAKGGYYPNNNEPMSQGTRCRQLALYMIYDSPLNMLCDSPTNYMAEHECTQFIAGIPTVWDETLPLNGKVGEFVTLARRSGDTWYIGGLTNWDKREMELDLSFLGEGNFKMELFRDGVNAHRKGSDYKREVIDIPASRKVKVVLAPGGGFAAKITK